MIVDNIINCSRYENNESWKKVFDYLKSVDENTLDGEYEIDGRDVFAVVVSYQSKSYADGVLEAHKKYYDIHYIRDGREKIYVNPVNECEPITQYDSEKDFILFEKDVKHKTVTTLEKGDFCVVSPDEAHAPSIRVGGKSEDVKKVVIKMAVDIV